MQKKLIAAKPPRTPWLLLPLRLFLGITFIYAGIQKFQDQQFFQPGTPGYIGKQMNVFSFASPLQWLILHVGVANASLIGILIAYGEIAVGLGILFGLLFRPASVFGFFFNILFFLTTSWSTYPYFYGSDLVFCIGWITLLLNGPIDTGLPVLDARLVLSILKNTPLPQRLQRAHLLGVITGVTFPDEILTSEEQLLREKGDNKRRGFLLGALAGSLLVIGGGASLLATHILKRPPVSQASTAGNTGTTAPSTGNEQNTSGSSGSGAIARVQAVPVNSSVSFTVVDTGETGLLIRLANGKFVAYNATCTHAGCQVHYIPANHLIECPCHGAIFDPANNGAVLHPPASQPLGTIAIQISSTGEIIPTGV